MDRKNFEIDVTTKWYDYFFLLRPILWVPLWVFVFLGFMYGKRIELFKITVLLPLKFYLTLLAYTLLMSSAYVVNQIVDRESDKINQKLFLIPYNIISIRSATIVAVILAVGALIASYYIGGITLLVLFLISLTMGLLYSLPPVQAKGRPFLDIIFNAFGYGCVAFAVGWAVAEKLNLYTLTISIGYFLLVSAIFINTTIPDIPGDKKSGKITTGVFLGKNNALIASSVLFALSIICAFLEMDLLILIPSIVGLALSILSIWDNTEDLILTKLSYRVPAFLFILFVAVKFPVFLILDLIILFLLRWYYKNRFNLDYPSFLGR